MMAVSESPKSFTRSIDKLKNKSGREKQIKLQYAAALYLFQRSGRRLKIWCKSWLMFMRNNDGFVSTKFNCENCFYQFAKTPSDEDKKKQRSHFPVGKLNKLFSLDNLLGFGEQRISF
jgi:hypothetical protein